MAEPSGAHDRTIRRQRWRLLAQFADLTEKPLIALAIIWLVLVIIDLSAGLSPQLLIINYIIWGIFILDFVMRMLIAPDRWLYLRRNWLTAISLLVPALRVLRAVQILRAARALRVLRATQVTRSAALVRVIGSINRSMGAARTILRRRGLGYVVTLTIVVTLAGAAGMRYFENANVLIARGYGDAVQNGAGFQNYGDALWWTAMVITTMGSENWPKTTEGRILCLLLSIYAFTIFGYITATIASVFIGQDAALAKRGI